MRGSTRGWTVAVALHETWRPAQGRHGGAVEACTGAAGSGADGCRWWRQKKERGEGDGADKWASLPRGVHVSETGHQNSPMVKNKRFL